MISPPDKIGKYEVLGVIGGGGMGVVYKARDPLLNRLVAIKKIRGATPGLLKRFDVEARSTGSLQHPNIVTIYDFGDDGGSPYLVMEYLEGRSLDSVLKTENNSLTLAGKLNICIEVCNGLNYAHERGIIHRDIKPANIMLLNDASVKIVDFGIARIGDTGISHTETVGTIHYMSPEQFQNQPLDHRTDIYSTGVVLYQLLTGTVPFQAPSDAAIMYQIVHDNPPPLRNYLQEYPIELDGILAKALAKNRDLRYPTGREFGFDLIAIAEKQKQFEVTHWLKRAETAAHRSEWSKAEDCLRKVLFIDGRHTQAHQLLSQVQTRIRQQRVAEQVRQLRVQADQAFLERRYDDALAIVEQAISVDQTNQGLSALRESIQAAKTRVAQFKSALRKAEEAQQAGDLAEAKQAVQQALEIEPHDTSAKAMLVVIIRQSEEQQRQQQVRVLIDRAREYLGVRDLASAYNALREAEQIDPSSSELISLLTVVNTARQEQARRAELDRWTREIEAALKREDHAAAIALVDEGLKRNPHEPGLMKLKALAEAEREAIQRKGYVREQAMAVSKLLEAGKTVEALSAIEDGLRRVPGEIQLETLRTVAKARLATDESEERKRQLLQRAQDLAASKKHNEATQILERAQQEFAGTKEIYALLETERAAQKQAEAIERARVEAQSLLSQGSFERAVQYLEKKTLEVPDERLFDLLENARRQAQQIQTLLRKAIQEGHRVLRENGADSAAQYLRSLPETYKENREFKALAATVDRHLEAEALDRELASTTEPTEQTRLAEAALRKSPDNEEIKKRLASVRALKEQTAHIVERAHVLEASMRYAEAAAELRRLNQLHPGSSIELEIRRLEKLDKDSKPIESPSIHEERQQDEFQATSVLASLPREAEARQSASHEIDGLQGGLPQVTPARRRRVSAVLIAVVVLAVTGIATYTALSRHAVPSANRASAEELALQSESDRLKASRNFDEARNVDRKLHDMGGALSDWANKDAERITQLLETEKASMDRAKAAETAKQWDLAIQDYQRVIDLHGTLETSAAAAIEDVKLKRSGADANQIADLGFRHGVDAFDRRDYQFAQKTFEEAIAGAPANWPRRSQASEFLKKSKNRYEQLRALTEAERELGAKHYDAARRLAGEASEYADGAPEASSKARQIAKEAGDHALQQDIFDQAVKQENTNPALAEDSFKKAIEFSDGDPDVVRRAKDELAKLSKNASVNTLIASIQSAIKAGNIDAAEEKLRSLDPSDPNYQRLRQSIDDAVFGKKVDEAEAAMRAPESQNRQASLRNLLVYFQGAAKLTNHNANLATRYAQDLDAALTTKSPPAAGGSGARAVVISAEDKAGIHALLNRYADIISRRRAKDLREVWPEIPKSQYEKYQAFVESHKKLSISITPEKWESHGTGFLVTCQQILAFEQDGKLETHPDAINFYVVKINDNWRISDIPASAAQ